MIWTTVQAQADDGAPPQEPSTEPPPGPTLELLDFIGSWVDEDDQWVDPADVAALKPAGKERNDDETD